MTATLVIDSRIHSELLTAASLNIETAGVLLCSIFESHQGDFRLLAREIRWVPDSAYAERGADYMSIKSDGYVPALCEAEEVGAAAIWLHTHPGIASSPTPSRHDKKVDRELAGVFRLRTGSAYYGAVVVGALKNGELTFTGHVDDGLVRQTISRLWVVGRRFNLIPAAGSDRPHLGIEYDRNIRAFGGAVQQVLADLRVGIVGCGGTGSAIAEQLVRLGVRRFHLVDPDRLSESNLTRVYGSSPEDVGKLKVTVIAGHLQYIKPDVDISTDPAMITVESSARRLTGCDLIFGCTDDNAGRLVLSRLSTYFLTPIIDCGVLLSSDPSDGRLSGIDGRVTTLIPGQACLVCRGRVDLQRANSEQLSPTERIRRIDEGYAPALSGFEPAVVTYTTLVSSMAVGELLERLVGFGPEPAPSEVMLRLHDREVSTNIAAPRDRHYCHPNQRKIGKGMTDPFLEQTWS